MGTKLANKVAVVTGASKGIGAAIAVHMAGEGASVVVNYASSKEGAERVVNQIRAKGGKAVAVKANLANPAEVETLFTETKKAFGETDILVNNAGIYEFKPLVEVSPEHYHKQFDLNVLGLLLATKEAVKHFGTRGGNVINISSVAAGGLPGGSVYSATKGAVDTITKALAQELGPQKIRVNSINPGMVETEGVRAAGIHESEFRTEIEKRTPLGRIGQPDDIAGAVTFLATDDARWITGETIHIAGGSRI